MVAVMFVVLSIPDGMIPESIRDAFHGVSFMSVKWPAVAIIVVALSPIWLLQLG